MELYETMLQYPAKREKIAAEIASFTQADGTAQVCAELAAILRRMQETQALAARPELSPELAAAAGASYALERQELAAIFTQICRALGTAGVTLSGGEISALKRQGMPDTLAAGLTFSGGEISALKRQWTPGTLAAALDALRREKIAALPAAERLDADTAAKLYNALTSTGLISGPWDTFAYYLAQQSTPAAKCPEKPLSWLKGKAEFAYFIERFPRKRKTPHTRALCLAFGYTDREIKNVIQSAHTHADEAKGTNQIDIIFNAL